MGDWLGATKRNAGGPAERLLVRSGEGTAGRHCWEGRLSRSLRKTDGAGEEMVESERERPLSLLSCAACLAAVSRACGHGVVQTSLRCPQP